MLSAAVLELSAAVLVLVLGTSFDDYASLRPQTIRRLSPIDRLRRSLHRMVVMLTRMAIKFDDVAETSAQDSAEVDYDYEYRCAEHEHEIQTEPCDATERRWCDFWLDQRQLPLIPVDQLVGGLISSSFGFANSFRKQDVSS